MAIARPRNSGPLTTGRRIGMIIMGAGIVVAVLAAWLVFKVVQGSGATVSAAQTVPQIYVVMATREVEQGSPIPADALAVKPFPKAFAPQEALTTLDQVNGKYATTRLTRDQIVLASQVGTARPVVSLTDSIPAGKVGLWMPVPELVAQTGMLRAGDKVDILLSLARPAAPGAVPDAASSAGLTTQTTLQNVELLFVGTPAAAPDQGTSTAQVSPEKPGAQPQAAAAGGTKTALFVFDAQDAVVAKFVKDSGGTIDFVMRPRQAQDVTRTVAVDTDALDARFSFFSR